MSVHNVVHNTAQKTRICSRLWRFINLFTY